MTLCLMEKIITRQVKQSMTHSYRGKWLETRASNGVNKHTHTRNLHAVLVHYLLNYLKSFHKHLHKILVNAYPVLDIVCISALCKKSMYFAGEGKYRIFGRTIFKCLHLAKFIIIHYYFKFRFIHLKATMAALSFLCI